MGDHPPQMKGIDVGRGQIDLRHIGFYAHEMRPTEIHHKADGAEEGKPSFAIVMVNKAQDVAFFGQVSLKMFNKALADIGYEIKRKET